MPDAESANPSSPAPPTPNTPRLALPSDSQPIAFRESDPCPGCGKDIKTEALVCLHCGYDFRKGARVQTATGVETIDTTPKKRSGWFSWGSAPAAASTAPARNAPADAQTGDDASDEREDLVKPGRGSPKGVAILAALLLVAACIAAGLAAGPSAPASRVLARIALTGFDGMVHSATGLIALAVTALFFELRLGRVDLAAARVAAAWCAFLLAKNIPLPIGAAAVPGAWVVAGAAYFLVAWALFARHPRVIGAILGMHIGLFALFQLALIVLQGLEAAALVPSGSTNSASTTAPVVP